MYVKQRFSAVKVGGEVYIFSLKLCLTYLTCFFIYKYLKRALTKGKKRGALFETINIF